MNAIGQYGFGTYMNKHPGIDGGKAGSPQGLFARFSDTSTNKKSYAGICGGTPPLKVSIPRLVARKRAERMTDNSSPDVNSEMLPG